MAFSPPMARTMARDDSRQMRLPAWRRAAAFEGRWSSTLLLGFSLEVLAAMALPPCLAGDADTIGRAISNFWTWGPARAFDGTRRAPNSRKNKWQAILGGGHAGPRHRRTRARDGG